MAFSTLEALQAFGAGRQLAIQDREHRRDEQLRTDLSAAVDPNTGAIDQTRGRQAYLRAGDAAGAVNFDEHMTAQHGREWTQNRDRIVAALPFLQNVHDEASYQQAVQQAHANGLDIAGAPPNFDPAWVQNVRTIGQTYLQQQHYQNPTAFQQDATAAGYRPGTPEFRAAFDRRNAQPRIVMVNGQPMLVAGGDDAAPPPQQNETIIENPTTGERLRLNPQTNQWEPVAQGGPGQNAPGNF